MSILKIISDANCSVRCDFQEVGNIQIGELFKLQLKKGCYILEFLVEDIVICSMDYTIETNDEEPLLRLDALFGVVTHGLKVILLCQKVLNALQVTHSENAILLL